MKKAISVIFFSLLTAFSFSQNNIHLFEWNEVDDSNDTLDFEVYWKYTTDSLLSFKFVNNEPKEYMFTMSFALYDNEGEVIDGNMTDMVSMEGNGGEDVMTEIIINLIEDIEDRNFAYGFLHVMDRRTELQLPAYAEIELFNIFCPDDLEDY